MDKLQDKFQGLNTTSDDTSKPREDVPTICFFWDIENCRVPPNKSPVEIAKLLRERFAHGKKEFEFACVCDSNKESKEIVAALNFAQVTVVHIQSGSKNAADDKLRSLIRKHADKMRPHDCMVIISGDINFAAELHDLKYKHHIHVIVLHPKQTNDALFALVTDYFSWDDLMDQVPTTAVVRNKNNQENNVVYIGLVPYPSVPVPAIVNRIRQLSSNVGGAINHNPVTGIFSVTFPNPDATRRAQIRLDGEDVYGGKISAKFHYNSDLHLDERRNSGQTAPIVQPQPPPALVNTRHARIATPPYQQLLVPYDSPFNLPRQQVSQVLVQRPPPPPFATFNNRQTLSASFFNRPRLGQPVPLPVEMAMHSARSAGDFRPLQEAARDPFPRIMTVPEMSGGHSNGPPRGIGSAQGVSSSSTGLLTSSSSSFMKKYVDGKKTSLPVDFANGEPAMRQRAVSGGRLNSNAENTEKVFQVYIENLDGRMDHSELNARLTMELQEWVPILHISIYKDVLEGMVFAHVVVSKHSDAKELIKRFDQCTFDKRTINVSLECPKSEPSTAIKRAVICIFRSSKVLKMPMIELMHIFERHYDQTLSLRTLKKMPEFLEDLEEENGPRIFRIKPVALGWESDRGMEGCLEVLPLGYCATHCSSEKLDETLARKGYKPLQCFRVSLRDFSVRVRQLVELHNGVMPLNTFIVCYENIYEKLKEDAVGGVHLEHLLRSSPRVEIVQLPGEGRTIRLRQMIKTRDHENAADQFQPTPVQEEVWDLLTGEERSSLPVAFFVDAYHSHGGRPCEAQTFDQTRTLRLLQSVSDDIEVLGSGGDRLVTLTHVAQLRRFADVLESIRIATQVQDITRANFGVLYGQVFEREFCPINFGVCTVDDLIGDSNAGIWWQHVLSTGGPAEPVVGQASPLLMMTLARESTQVLTKSPQYRQDFLRFPSAYRKLFGRDFRNIDYGYTKLIDVCNAMRGVVEVVTYGKQRWVWLALPRRLDHLREIIPKILSETKKELGLAKFKRQFKMLAGHDLLYENYGCTSYEQLFALFPDVIDMEKNGETLLLQWRNPGISDTTTDESIKSSHSGGDDSSEVPSSPSPPVHEESMMMVRHFVANEENVIHNVNSIEVVQKPCATAVDSGFSEDEREKENRNKPKPDTPSRPRLAMNFG